MALTANYFSVENPQTPSFLLFYIHAFRLNGAAHPINDMHLDSHEAYTTQKMKVMHGLYVV